METPTHTAPPVVSTDLFSVDGKTDLCLRLMVYAALDDRHGDLRPSQVRENLSVFFPQETIQTAENLLKEGWIPPSVDLSFYSENAEVSDRRARTTESKQDANGGSLH